MSFNRFDKEESRCFNFVAKYSGVVYISECEASLSPPMVIISTACCGPMAIAFIPNAFKLST